MYPIVNYVPMFMGFQQSPKNRTGMDNLFKRLMLIESLNLYIPPPKLWKAWVGDELMYSVRHLADRHTHWVIGYSYGGHAAVQYCWKAYHEDEQIDGLFLIDPVKRLKGARWSWVARSASLLPLMKHKVPPNVKECWFWRQRTSKPKGHMVAPSTGNTITKWHDRGFMPKSHIAMDNVGVIHDVIATQIVNGLIMPSE